MEARRADGLATDRRAVFRDAALQLWADAGWAAVTVGSVCAATGLTEADFAAEYDSPEDLLGEVFDEGTEERTALVLAAVEAAPRNRIAQLRAGLDAMAGYVERDPRHVVTLVEAIGCPALRRRRRATNRGFAALISSGSGGLPDPADPREVHAAAVFCIAGFHELLFAWFDPESPVGRDLVVDHAARLFEACLSVR
ncbi:TetR/AcrR family transcriptional regulator [Pseudonocardia sp. RS010]|uniref:TetR/AcrR family transcriptional regulator n=1 Tax=Pseudonocardia sp. RS010 TaxID=3385979 RepID=UPI0039A361F7